jgi:hypothetical protein
LSKHPNPDIVRFLGSELEHEVAWEAVPVAFDLLVQVPRWDSVEGREIAVKHHPLITK